MLLRYDYSNMAADKADLPAVLSSAKAARAAVWSRREELGFLSAASSVDVALIEALAKKIRKSYETLLVIGIGGSDLGTRAIYEALVQYSPAAKKRAKGGPMKLVFLGNTDPEEVAAKLAGVNLKKTAVNVVSKSGGTAEILANFFLVKGMLERAVGKARAAERIIATTDASTGLLRKVADEAGWAALSVPKNIGGRFSALTAVGLFPAACAGIKINALLAGAKEAMRREEAGDAPALDFAALQYLMYKKGKNISVLMPYSAALFKLAFWYRQLWAESLGKSADVGPTPVAALGARDQHSQLQLYQDGPKDKVITFIEVERFRKNFQVPTFIKSRSGTLAVQGHSFEEIIHAERLATASALKDAGRPNGTIFVPKVSEETVGALLQFFMLSAAYAGAMFGVNAFNQPGVELVKQKLVARLEGK